MQKEIPILFSPSMTAAIISGKKTVTRRIIKGVALQWLEEGFKTEYISDPGNSVICPYGKAGDILWVRESYRLAAWDFEDEVITFEYKDGSKCELCYNEFNDDMKASEWLDKKIWSMEGKGFLEVINDEANEENIQFKRTKKECPFTPSIHLPKFGSRIWLQVADIKCERLHRISEVDAIAEGVETLGLYPGFDISAIGKFEGLWSLINGHESWELNPWVWVVSFKLLSTTGKPDILCNTEQHNKFISK